MFQANIKQNNLLLNSKIRALSFTSLLLWLSLFITTISLAKPGDGLYFAGTIGGAYLSGLPINLEYYFPISKITGGRYDDDPGISQLNDELDRYNTYITDTKYGYKISLALGYSHIIWGLRPEIEASFFSNAGLFNKTDECGLRDLSIYDSEGKQQPGGKNPFNGQRPDSEWSNSIIPAICEAKARNIAYGMVNFILDIPIGDSLSSIPAIPPTSPYIGLGFGVGTCNQNDDKAGFGFSLNPAKDALRDEIIDAINSDGNLNPERFTELLTLGSDSVGEPLGAPVNCKGGAIQLILGIRQNWDTYFSSTFDFRYTQLQDLGIISLNIGFIQTFD